MLDCVPKEVERSARIGRAFKKALENGYTLMKLVDTEKIDVRYEDEYEESIYEEIDDLLEWVESEE